MANSAGSSRPRAVGTWSSAPDLALQQRQVVQWVEDEVLALVGPGMTGDLVRCAGDYYFVDITAEQHLTMAIRGRHRVVVAAVTHQ